MGYMTWYIAGHRNWAAAFNFETESENAAHSHGHKLTHDKH